MPPLLEHSITLSCKFEEELSNLDMKHITETNIKGLSEKKRLNEVLFWVHLNHKDELVVMALGMPKKLWSLTLSLY